jgi:hypothetical protein
MAKASISTDGTYWTAVTSDTDYLSHFYPPQGSGSMTTTANLEYHIRPDLFVPDDYANGEVDIAVFARLEIASTQVTPNCVLSVAPQYGSDVAGRTYSEFHDTGRTLTVPSSGTVFRLVYLGTVTCRVDADNPVPHKLRLAFTNSVSSTGTFGVDYLCMVPARNVASSRRGVEAADVPTFITSTTSESKIKRIESDLSGSISVPSLYAYQNNAYVPDDGLLGERIIIGNEETNLLVLPSDVVIDATDSDAANNDETYTGSVQVSLQPMHHLFRQG